MKLKILEHHIRQFYGLTPDAYRHRWGLPDDYPMVAPNYAQERAEMARRMDLTE